MNIEELKALADQCICHAVSRGIGEIEAAGEGIKTLIADLESAQDERRALLATEQNLMERVKALEEGLSFYAAPGDYKAPFTGGLGKLYYDCGETARALLEKTV